MAEANFSKLISTNDYGRVYSGHIEAEHGTIAAELTEPLHPDQATLMYLNFNGLSASFASMDLPAQRAARAGQFALKMNYSNNDLLSLLSKQGALARNRKDCLAAIAAVPERLDIGLVGLSLGGLMAILSTDAYLNRLQPGERSRIRSVNAVAAPCLNEGGIGFAIGVLSLIASAPEALNLATHDVSKRMRLFAACFTHSLNRSAGFTGDIVGLTSRMNVRDEVVAISEHPQAPYLRAINGAIDHLVPARRQRPAVASLPFDESIWYNGGHVDFAFKPELSDPIFAGDLELGQPSLELVA